MSEEKKIGTTEDADTEMQEVVAVIHQDKSITLEPMKSKKTSYLSKAEIAEIAKDVVNLLAEKNCTIEEADDVLRIAKLSIDNTSTVRKIEY